MAFRIILAALIGGALAFTGGFVEHMQLDWVGRQMSIPTDEAGLPELFKKHFPAPGIYGFPHLPKDYKKLSEAEFKKAWDEVNEKYKAGPAAYVVVAPTGEDAMGNKQLIGEYITNALAALLAAIVVSMTRPSIGFAGRWFAVVLIGLFSWVSINASYHIWYRFPLSYVQDELYCALLEWAAAGIAIALIVKPRDNTAGY